MKEKLIEIKNNSFITKKQFIDTNFSTIKTRRGKESVPFLGLSPGTYKIKITKDNGKSKIYKIKTWLSMYGYAWQAVEELKE